MIFKSGIIILGVVIIGLVIGLVVMKRQADDLHIKDTASILDFSNQLDTANINLEGLRQGNLMLTNDLATAGQAFEATSNNLAEMSGQLTGAKTANESNQSDITNLNGHIGVLEPLNEVLNERAASLSNNIVLLNVQIAATQQQLVISQTNNVFLAAELQKQMAQKAELEHRFNDLDAVRAQVRYLSFGYY